MKSMKMGGLSERDQRAFKEEAIKHEFEEQWNGVDSIMISSITDQWV